VGTVPKPGAVLAQTDDAAALVSAFVGALSCSPLTDETTYAAHCNCSKARILNSVSSLGPTQLQEMIAEDNTFEVICHFCGKDWAITPNELRRVLQHTPLH
jgi:molecular chaperone Hsp33